MHASGLPGSSRLPRSVLAPLRTLGQICTLPLATGVSPKGPVHTGWAGPAAAFTWEMRCVTEALRASGPH